MFENIIKVIEVVQKRPTPLLSFLEKVRQENLQLAQARIESGQSQTLYIKRPVQLTSPTAKPRESYPYVV